MDKNLKNSIIKVGDKVSLKGYRNRLFGTVVKLIHGYDQYGRQVDDLIIKTKPIKKQFMNGGYNFNDSTDLVIYKTM